MPQKCGVVWAASHAVSSERRKHNTFNVIDKILWKFKFHLKYFPGTALFIDLYRLSGYLYFFKKQPACRKTRGSFFAVFYHREDISCKVWVATWIDTTTNSFLWISRFTTILSQCRGSPWYQVQSKNSWNWILLISETWFWFYQRQPPEVSCKNRCS